MCLSVVAKRTVRRGDTFEKGCFGKVRTESRFSTKPEVLLVCYGRWRATQTVRASQSVGR